MEIACFYCEYTLQFNLVSKIYSKGDHIMSFLSKIIPEKLKLKKKPIELKNNLPKEKANIKKTFGVYCNAHHGTKLGPVNTNYAMHQPPVQG